MEKLSLPEKKKAQKMDIIMHDALHYFEKNGYDNTTIEQLCDAAMISESTFFNYFGSKEKLVELIMLDGLKDFREASAKAMAQASDPFDGVKEGLLALCDALAKYTNTVSVFHRLALQRDNFREIETMHADIAADMIEDAFKKTGRPCPYSRNALMDIIGGCLTYPYLSMSPKDAPVRARQSVTELVQRLKNG